MGTILVSPGVLTTKKVASTSTPLAASATYTSNAATTFGYTSIRGFAFSDQASATNGLSIQQSMDATNWDVKDEFTVSASTEKPFRVDVAAPYVRIVYTNGLTNQTSFRLYALLARE